MPDWVRLWRAAWGLIDQLDVGAVALLKCACVLLASARLKRSAALTVVTGLKGVTVSLKKQSLAKNAHSFLLVSSFKNQYVLSGSALGTNFRLASQHSASHVVGAVGAAEGGDSHESRVGVEALASCPFILHLKPPLSTLVVHNLQQIKAHPVLHPHQIPVAATDRVDKSEFSTIGQMLI